MEIQRSIANVEDFRFSLFTNITDRAVKRYLIQAIGSRNSTIGNINFNEYVEIIPAFSISNFVKLTKKYLINSTVNSLWVY